MGRILLGGNTKGGREGAVILSPIRFQCVQVWISAGLPRTQNKQLTIAEINSALRKRRLALDFPERNYCVSRGVSGLPRTEGL